MNKKLWLAPIIAGGLLATTAASCDSDQPQQPVETVTVVVTPSNGAAPTIIVVPRDRVPKGATTVPATKAPETTAATTAPPTTPPVTTMPTTPPTVLPTFTKFPTFTKLPTIAPTLTFKPPTFPTIKPFPTLTFKLPGS